MSEADLNKLASHPKLAPTKRKLAKKTRTVKELFEDVDQDVRFKDKRGRPWLKNPRAYAKTQVATKNKMNRDATESTASLSDSADGYADGEEGDNEDEEETSHSEAELNSESNSEANFHDDDRTQSEWIADLCEMDWRKLSEDAAPAAHPTSRLAMLHFDWDNAKAENIYMALSSFLPPKGHISKVTIYPSEFGLKRMAEEATQGPRELLQMDDVSDNNADPTVDKPGRQAVQDPVADPEADAEESVEIDDRCGWRSASLSLRRQIRRYQLARLKYFYAIIEFDSPETAQHVYEACDGYEYKSSGIRFDLRFVDDNEVFSVPAEHAHLVNECHEVNRAKYTSRSFETAALHSTRIGITWDKTPEERTRWLQEQFKPEADPKHTLTEHRDELVKYLALSSSGASTAAGSDVDEPPPAPTVPRIRRHRPKRLPPNDLRNALLEALGENTLSTSRGGDSSEKESETGESEIEEEEVLDLNDQEAPQGSNADSDLEEGYDLRPVEKKVASKAPSAKHRVRRRILPEAMDFDMLEEVNSLSDDGEDAGGESREDGEKLRNKRRKMRQRDRISAKKLKIRDRIHRQTELAASPTKGDARFDAFLTDPAFSVSRTNPDYEEAVGFLAYMRGRKASQ